MTLRLAGFAGDSIVDGPGIRFTTFCQGCPHHCPGCQNPETWPFEGGFEVTPEDVVEHVKRNPLTRGATFSGGEPFAQAAAHAELARQLKAAGYEVASYTGYTFEQLLEEQDPAKLDLLQQLDILVDGPFRQEELSLELRFRGSANQRILNVPQRLAQGKAMWETRPRWVGDEIH